MVRLLQEIADSVSQMLKAHGHDKVAWQKISIKHRYIGHVEKKDDELYR